MGPSEKASLKAETLGSSREGGFGVSQRRSAQGSPRLSLLHTSCLELWVTREIRSFPDDNVYLPSLSDSLLPSTLLKPTESLRQLGST